MIGIITFKCKFGYYLLTIYHHQNNETADDDFELGKYLQQMSILFQNKNCII